MSSITLYRSPVSGHAHRVELLLSLLNLEFNSIDINLAAGEHKTPEFLQKNSLGQIPVLEDGDITLADSNAILVYLAKRYDSSAQWLPEHAVDAAEVQRFLSIAAGEIARGPALARKIIRFKAPFDLAPAQATAKQILLQLDQHLTGRDWLATAAPTIADLANYAYIARAPEGGIELSAYSNILAWLARVENLKDFVTMAETPSHL